MYIGSFAGDFTQLQVDIAAAFDQFLASGVTNLVIDVTENGGLYGFMMEMPNNLTSNDCRWVRLRGIIPPSVPWWYGVWNTVGALNVKVRWHI
jgi:hypothetical protein